MTFAGGEKYVGEWKDDKRHGQGTFTFTDGEKYVGEWKDDKRNGQGTDTSAKLTLIEIQRILKHLGIYKKKVGGIFGKNTEKAIKKWQSLNKFSPTGYISDNQNRYLKNWILSATPFNYKVKDVSEKTSKSKSKKVVKKESGFFAEIGEGISLIAGWISIVFVALYLILLPKSDKRFTTGFKDNAEDPGCILPTIAIVAGRIWFFINYLMSG